MVKDPILELKETTLFQYLNSLDKNLADKCIQFVNNIAPILDSIVEYFPYYTRHDTNHSYNVLKQMAEIMQPNCLIIQTELSLNKSEAFLLICSAYGHDLGMAILPGEESVLLNSLGIPLTNGWKNDEKLQEFLRKTHSERGSRYILSQNDSIGIPIHFVQLLSLLMKSHNLSLNALRTELGKRFSIDNQEINLLQLACILCIADLIEFSDTRVIDGVINQLQEGLKESNDPTLKTSLTENLKHICLGSNLAVGKYDGKIIMNGVFDDPEVLNTTYKTVDYIEKWIRDYCDIDYEAKHKRLRIRNDSVYTTFDIPGKKFERLGIRINKQNVIALISSNAIWNNRPEMVIRELLQNSVEACRYRRHYSLQSEGYNGKIDLVLNKQENSITIIDNGCGMSRSIILNNFLTVGNSRAKELDYEHDNYASLARFGIGFWSVFTIADVAIVETAEYKSNSNTDMEGLKFEVSINVLKDYILFEQKPRTPGTQIKLILKEHINLNELANKITGIFGVILCSEIPINIKFGEIEFTVPKSPFLPNLRDLFGAKINYVFAEKVELFTRNIAIGDITIDSFIIFRKVGRNVSFLFSSNDPISISPSSYEIKAICGFTIRYMDTFPIYEILSGSIFGYIANNKSPKGFEYNITRQLLLPSEAATEFSDTIAKQFVETFREFLKSHSSYDPEAIVRLYEESCTGLQRGGTYDTSDKLLKIISLAPDLLCYKLYRIEQNRTLSNCSQEFFNITDLLNKDYQIISAVQHFSVHGGRRSLTIPNDSYYLILKDHIDFAKSTFFIKRGDSDLLFNNDPNSYIIYKRVQFTNEIYSYVAFFVSHTSTIDAKTKKDWNLGSVSGAWAGYIGERKIKGAKFAFVQQKCFIEPGTELSKDVREFYNQGRYSEICNLMNLLELSLHGHVDPSIIKYM